MNQSHRELSQPLVCICVPNYNNEKTIVETLNSLVAQTYKNIIIKVFDNASTDSSLKILHEFEKKHSNIQVFKSENNVGGEANFTKCIKSMEGKYSAVYHSDDIYLPTIIEEQVSYLELDKHLVSVSTNALRYDPINNTESILYDFSDLNFSNGLFKINSQVNFIKVVLLKGNVINCPSVMCRTSVYKEHIKHWDGLNFNTSADLDVWFRMAEKGSFGIIEKPLLKYRVSSSSYSYNMARSTTKKSDFFLVIDEYLSRPEYSRSFNAKDFSNYEALSFKDFLLISTNINLNKGFLGFWHFKRRYNVSFMFNYFFIKRSKKDILIFLFYLITLLAPRRKSISKFLFKLRFGS